MSLRFTKIILLCAGLSLLLAIPVSLAYRGHIEALKIEREQVQQFKVEIKSIQREVDDIEQQVKQRQQDNEQLKKENQELQKQLQAKAEQKAEQQRLAAIEAERARKAPVVASMQATGGGCEQYRGLVSKYAWNVDVAMSVMRAESGCNPSAANTRDNHGVCMGSFGLFQISCHGGRIFDPAQNVAAAWGKYQARGWQPWGVCTSGKVSCF